MKKNFNSHTRQTRQKFLYRLMTDVRTLCAIVSLTAFSTAVHAQDSPAPTTPTATPAEVSAQPSPAPDGAAADAASPVNLPHIRINREKGWVDFDAKIVLRDGQWVELLVCTPGSREYESIMTSEALPSHIHLALLILGLTPGSPMGMAREGDNLVATAPKGPQVAVSLHYHRDGKPVSIPAGQWIMDRKANATLPESTWLFAGSKFLPVEDRAVYTADVNGSTISLVNFGDELLTRATTQTNRSDGGQLAANTKLIPALGTMVVVRLTPVPKPVPKTPQPTASPDAANPAPESAGSDSVKADPDATTSDKNDKP